MTRMILGILMLIVLLVSPCAADTITLNAGESYRWDFIVKDKVINPGPLPYLYPWDAYISINASWSMTLPVDSRISYFNPATNTTPAMQNEITFPWISSNWFVKYGLTPGGWGGFAFGDVMNDLVAIQIEVILGCATFEDPFVWVDVPSVPIPSTILLLGSGLLGLAGWRSFRKG